MVKSYHGNVGFHPQAVLASPTAHQTAYEGAKQQQGKSLSDQEVPWLSLFYQQTNPPKWVLNHK